MSDDGSPDTRRRLMAAGAAALRYNAPLGQERVGEIEAFLDGRAERVVDLGCGAGALLVELASRRPGLQCFGLDIAPTVIARATRAAAEAGVADRARFEVGNVTGAVASADAALCIGSTHAFGAPRDALQALLGFGRSAVVADGVWSAPPDPEHRAMFGELPDGEDGLAAIAESVGWTIVGRDRSSIEEWDEFEHGWIGGVRAVGTPEAEAFADERLEDYRSYRGVLGFGWLFLTR